jgi:hypothetical protein
MRNPLDDLKNDSGKGSYTDPRKTPGSIAEIRVCSLQTKINDRITI